MLPRQAISAPSAWRFRPVLKWLHLWLGLSVGLVFAIVSLTGTVLAFQSELLLAAHPELDRERLPPLALQGHALARIVAGAEDSGIRSVDLPSPRLPAWQAFAAQGERHYFDPANGELLLVRNTGNDAVMWLRDLHTHLLAGEAGEQVLVQVLLAEGPVEAFDVGVLVGLAGLDVLDGHAVELGPLHEGLAQELRAVVGPQHLRQPMVALQLLEDPNQP